MTVQQYFVVENNIVTNSCMWDGNTNTWQPPADATMLISATTPAMVWGLNFTKDGWVLVEEIGAGDIGFTWDGTVLTTNLPEPPKPKPQPISTGTMSA